jgi:hypothetical protein
MLFWHAMSATKSRWCIAARSLRGALLIGLSEGQNIRSRGLSMAYPVRDPAQQAQRLTGQVAIRLHGNRIPVELG